jgi:hypothetical protein
LVAAGAMALAAVARLHHDLSIDEPFTALAVASPSLGLTLVHDNAPLFYGLLRAWARVFGDSAVALRAMSIAAFGGAIVFSAAAARRAASSRAAVLTALLVGGSVPFGLIPADTARPYALAACCAALTLWMAMRAGETAAPPLRAGAPLAAAHLLGLFTHPMFLFVSFLFVSAASTAAAVVAARRRWLLAAAPAIAIGVYLLAWWRVLALTAALPARTWMGRPTIADLVTGVMVWGDHATLVLGGLTAALLFVRPLPKAVESALAYTATIVVLMLGAAFAVSHVTPVYSPTRTPVFVLPAVSLVCGIAIAELAPRWIAAAAAIVIVASAARYTVHTARQPDPFPTRASVAAVAARAACGDTVVTTGLSFAPVSYYAPAAHLPACVTVTPFPEDVAEHAGWLDLSPAAVSVLPKAAASRVARLPRSGTVWLFEQREGVGAVASSALERELSTHRRASETLPLTGSFFDQVKVFAPGGERP